MPGFEILWAPLSRKWQVWQRLSDSSGCTIETLIGEHSSEGRAVHEVAVLRGDIPAGTAYEPPHRRRWFSFGGSSKPNNRVGVVDTTAAPAPASSSQSSEPAPLEARVQPLTVGENDAWRKNLIAQIDRARLQAEQDEVESVRRILEEALRFIPRPDRAGRAA